MHHLTNQMSTAELQALDAAHHIHPFNNNKELAENGARVIVRAQRATLTDSEGRSYFDGMSGMWCVNIGYGRDELADAANRQMRELPYYNTFFQSTHLPAVVLSKAVAEVTPEGLNHTLYGSSGSEANDTNIRMVRHYWAAQGKASKTTIISRKNAYHGSTIGGASLGGFELMHAQGGLPIPGIVHIDQPYWWAEGGDMDPDAFGLERARQLEKKILELGADKVAAFIGEPIQGAGGVIIPPKTYWPEIQRICEEYDILLIADEVICGFGRTGNWFGSQTFGIKPDIITVAKGISSGYAPIAGSVFSDRVAEVISSSPLYHGYTYSAHPVAAAVALENIRILEEEGIIGTVQLVMGPYFKEKWMALADHPLVGDARICGFMAALQLTSDKSRRSGFAIGTGTIGLMCREACIANGLMLRSVDDQIVVAPPLIVNKPEIDRMIATIVDALDRVYDLAGKHDLLKAA